MIFLKAPHEGWEVLSLLWPLLTHCRCSQELREGEDKNFQDKPSFQHSENHAAIDRYYLISTRDGLTHSEMHKRRGMGCWAIYQPNYENGWGMTEVPRKDMPILGKMHPYLTWDPKETALKSVKLSTSVSFKSNLRITLPPIFPSLFGFSANKVVLRGCASLMQWW